MNPIRCIITDDEPYAGNGLARYVRQYPFLRLEGIYEDAFQLRQALQVQKVDLLFLDIEMPYLNGIELLQSLEHPPKVIFTTAYEQYALQGFELDILDYLLKPISPERFGRAVQKVKDYFTWADKHDAGSFFVKVNGRLENVRVAEIVFVEALENYVAIHMDGKKLVTHATLKSMAQNLPRFIQPHKSYLVNPNHITGLEQNRLICGRFIIPVSKYQKEKVTAFLQNKEPNNPNS